MLRLAPQLHLSSEIHHFVDDSSKKHVICSQKAVSEPIFVNQSTITELLSFITDCYRYVCSTGNKLTKDQNVEFPQNIRKYFELCEI